ncbi:prephenate/arogenate dehydrogenase family protein [Ancylobacter sp. 6x-1]|uniref:Prephenate/arogenate dehydrogenase family protein n=1 Tax=Ancylobacter crimeensis TaxID=2579147 RepID=A0ABT0DD30_9HYPH|nr:prephenate/arogenate dehydrogenase family protein [Ancylobacter crimeensis]MCK0197876.1 prephenate/arogenate dehydrogenase family protein [Ancylobacter crimeensis]
MVLDPPLPKPLVGRLTVIGLGLIGSSILRAALARRLADEVVAYDHFEPVRSRVEALGIADRVAATPEEAVTGADVVILCVPVGAMGAVGEDIGPHVAPGAIISDVGSVKASVAKALAGQIPDYAHVIPAHPVAGTEYSGPDAGFATLFQNRWCILTPPEGADEGAVDLLEEIWAAMGANVERMSAERHDLVLAITSHVPHLIAYNIVGTAADLETVTQSEVIKYSAGGFRDFTRIAASDPTMWRDVFLNNREAVIEVLGRFTEDLFALQRAIRWEQGDALFELFTRTRAIRRSIIEQGQETAAPDFGRAHD